MKKDGTKYHYFVQGFHKWFAWGRGANLLEALDHCRSQLDLPPSIQKLQKIQFFGYKFPEDYTLEFDGMGNVTFQPGESKDPVDMKLVTKIKLFEDKGESKTDVS